MFNMIVNVLHYAFNVNRPTRDDTAQRSGFMQFQSYPQNPLGGPGQLYPGTIKAYQPPQTIVNNAPIISDIYGGGQPRGMMAMQPLINTKEGG